MATRQAERTKQLSDVPGIGNTAAPQSDAPNAAAQQPDAPNAAAPLTHVDSLTASPPGAALQPNAEAPRPDAHSTGAPQPDRSDTVAVRLQMARPARLLAQRRSTAVRAQVEAAADLGACFEGSEDGTDEGSEDGTDEGSEDDTDEGSEDGTDEGSEDGTDVISEEEVSEDGTDEGSEGKRKRSEQQEYLDFMRWPWRSDFQLNEAVENDRDDYCGHNGYE